MKNILISGRIFQILRVLRTSSSRVRWSRLFRFKAFAIALCVYTNREILGDVLHWGWIPEVSLGLTLVHRYLCFKTLAPRVYSTAFAEHLWVINKHLLYKFYR